jgi:hypothetical protein
MSQQEFVPESQSQAHGPFNDDEVYYPRAPYSWTGKLENEALPRDEPPSSYGELRVQQGYQAQADAGQNGPSRANQSADDANSHYAQAWQRPERSNGNGNGYARGYGPYSSFNTGQGASGGPGQSVPPWARPQQHRRGPLRFGSILLILVTIVLIQGLIRGGSFISVSGDLFGAILGLLLFVLIVPVIILVVFSGLLMRMFRAGGLYRRRSQWRRRQWPHGPYWW